MLAVAQDEELSKMLGQSLWTEAGVVPMIEPALLKRGKAGKVADKPAEPTTQEV